MNCLVLLFTLVDIDKLKYPIGSGRVRFPSKQNFILAILAPFVDIKSFKFSKRVQIDPYLEDVQCCLCKEETCIYFCRDFKCFNYLWFVLVSKTFIRHFS